jgi:hypothetical protein
MVSILLHRMMVPQANPKCDFAMVGFVTAEGHEHMRMQEPTFKLLFADRSQMFDLCFLTTSSSTRAGCKAPGQT